MAENKDEKPQKSPIALREEEILQFWKERNIFQKSIDKEAPLGDFVFYEGPPTANGRPGIHHLEARAFKDIIPRYKTMRGFRVQRKAGWDTHGLPVELEVEKKLGLKSKKEIESYGIEKFNDECKKSVWTYVDEWKQFTDRVGYWVDLEHPYVTYKPEYIESVWNILGEVEKKNLLYKDYKVLPWCPRCGTALSSHELAQGYQDDKDLAVTAKFELVDEPNTFFLAWTTTPWTLPGNVALAVGPELEYVKVQCVQKLPVVTEPLEKHTKGALHPTDEIFWLEKTRYENLKDHFDNAYHSNSVIDTVRGSKLIGKTYKPLYPYLGNALPENQKSQLANAFRVYEADFVTTEDGTGIVHTAVMYGQDDFVLGTKYNLPKFHIVDDSGHFTNDVTEFAGRFVKDEDVAVDIIKDLAHRGLLFKKEKYEHSYPHCWRCKTPLIYYARDSWYIRMSSLRDTLLAENEKINWEPNYIKDGRFGEWLREVKDWAISRERYWGTPLPIWQTEDKTETLVVDSVETLKKYGKKSGNKYFVIRHGESVSNVKGVINCTDNVEDNLTEAGIVQTKESAKILKDKSIDLIISSPLSRTKQTASLVAEVLECASENIVIDERLTETQALAYDGRPWAERRSEYVSPKDSFTKEIPGNENLLSIKRRVGDFLYDIENRYQNKNIVIVSHGAPLSLFPYVVDGLSLEQILSLPNYWDPKNAEIKEFAFTPLPHNSEYELDLHRPFIDDIVLVKDGKEFRRVKEVLDVWFDSGAMPFAQNHYPFDFAQGKPKAEQNLPFPADYISEAIDQTRGWFYTLHAIGVLTGRGHAYKNVMCLGHLLDKDGKKMSKSVGNVINPWEMIDLFGVDALRFWMYTVNQPGESKNFDPKTVDEVVKKVFNLLLNVMKFYEPFVLRREVRGAKSDNVLDVWILAELESLTFHMTKSLDDFKILEAARMIRDFIGDLSQWYLRRSRDRFKGDDEEDKQKAVNTLGQVLEQLSILMAPFMPFLAEDMYQKLKTEGSYESVHLAPWPEVVAESVGQVMSLTSMKEVRRLVSLGLEARSRAGIKVRQPLSLLTLQSDSLKSQTEYLAVLMDEVNVKNIAFDTALTEEVVLDTHIDESLKREGEARELIRAIQDMRKEKGLLVQDLIKVRLAVTPWGRLVLEDFSADITSTCSISELSVSDLPEGSEPWFSFEF